ncbi:ELM1/GtrOC1 family putative glycosyltransferase [Chthonobacter rhizosphaerae]|uniref:ELM1/GtrOC1 family putative glycosyltransferase n=1 Tax=Chthonobacter rhizosphaerae TaxID=2735553 RepID=UPI0015EF6424|nr:ELM1/GtrOC1 family putative glycosyltransferase [Chthonobacter rhizosphaerae]
MRVLLLRDKKPGHFNQVEAVGRILAEMGAAVDRVDVRPAWYAHGEVLKAAANHWRGAPGTMLRRLYGFDSDRAAPGLLVGSGRPTIAAGMFLRRQHGAPFLYIGRVSGYPSAEVDRQIVHNPREAHDSGCVWAPLPTLIRRADLPAPRPLATPGDLAGATVGLLVGGPAHGHHFDDGDWTDLENLVAALASRGVRWLATSSRRTPVPVIERCRALERHGIVERFVDHRAEGAGSAEAIFAADALVVTEDSQSMIAEALAAGRPVVALKPRRVSPSSANEIVAAWAAAGGLSVVPLRAPADLVVAALIATSTSPDPEPVLSDVLRAVLEDLKVR